jgi:hypothetical protein
MTFEEWVGLAAVVALMWVVGYEDRYRAGRVGTYYRRFARFRAATFAAWYTKKFARGENGERTGGQHRIRKKDDIKKGKKKNRER